jgi:uncharacterized protein (DUF1778 family)
MSAASQAKPQGKTRLVCLGTRITAAENAMVKAAAEAAGLTRSEWCRKAVMQAASFSSDMRIVLAEVVGTRQVLVGLVGALLPGNEDIVRHELAAADIRKFPLADSRIKYAREQGL